MKLQKLTLESKLYGNDMYKIIDWASIDDIIEVEKNLINQTNLTYLYCEIDSTDLQTIHAVENFGYHFSEFRVISSFKLNDLDIGKSSLYPYYAELITDNKNYTRAKKMLSDMNADDRFSKDPALGQNFSLTRRINNLNKSFKHWPKEFLVGIFNQQSDDLIAFRSGALLSKKEAYFYQYGVNNDKNHDHTCEILDSLTLIFLKELNIEFVHAVSTGFNTEELNRLINLFNFKVVSSKVLMRKIIGS
jgi:hypothetical protein